MTVPPGAPRIAHQSFRERDRRRAEPASQVHYLTCAGVMSLRVVAEISLLLLGRHPENQGVREKSACTPNQTLGERAALHESPQALDENGGHVRANSATSDLRGKRFRAPPPSPLHACLIVSSRPDP